jgi:hypothetical protein
MTSTAPNPENVPTDITNVEADETQLEKDTATLAADDGATPVVGTLAIAAIPTQGGTVGVNYKLTLVVTGGTPTYSYALTGAPPGIVQSASILGGTPSAAGTYQVTVVVTDKSTPAKTAKVSFEFIVAAASALLTMGTVAPETFTVGTVIKPIPLTASGGSGTGYTYTVGGLTPGLSIVGSNIEGTPQANPAGAGDTNTMTFTVKDSAGNTATFGPVTFTTNPSTVTPPPPSGAVVPNAPASLNAPTTIVLDDEFDTGSLNTSIWAPFWYANGDEANNTKMEESNVSVGANGLELALTSANTGGLINSQPWASGGFSISPTGGGTHGGTGPVYIEFQATLQGTGSTVANWPALWLDGQTWPEDGEIDVMEGLGGGTAYHIHYGSGSGSSQGETSNTGPGEHTYGVLWTAEACTFVYDGKVVGTTTEALSGPMGIIMENSIGSPSEVGNLTVRYVRVWQNA